MLDGKEATAEDIKNAQGTVTMDVSFLMAENTPYLALSVMPSMKTPCLISALKTAL